MATVLQTLKDSPRHPPCTLRSERMHWWLGTLNTSTLCILQEQLLMGDAGLHCPPELCSRCPRLHVTCNGLRSCYSVGLACSSPVARSGRLHACGGNTVTGLLVRRVTRRVTEPSHSSCRQKGGAHTYISLGVHAAAQCCLPLPEDGTPVATRQSVSSRLEGDCVHLMRCLTGPGGAGAQASSCAGH